MNFDKWFKDNKEKLDRLLGADTNEIPYKAALYAAWFAGWKTDETVSV